MRCYKAFAKRLFRRPVKVVPFLMFSIGGDRARLNAVTRGDLEGLTEIVDQIIHIFHAH